MNRLFIQLYPDDRPEIAWLRQGAQDDEPVSQTGSLSDLSAQAADCQVVVFAPGSDVSLLMADMPPMTRQRMAMAVPFALEDLLIADIDSLHFALGRQSEDKLVPVAVVADDLIAGWLSRLEDAGIRPELLIPETLALPFEPDAWTILMDADGALVRSGVLSGFAADLSTLPLILRGTCDIGDDSPQRIRLLRCQGAAIELPPLGCEVMEEPCPDRLQTLAGHFDEQRAINLLQGKYSRETGVKQIWRAWRIPVALVVVWFVVWVAGALLDIARLSEQNRTLDSEIENVYRRVFPDARNMRNLRVRMARGLDELRKTDARDTVGFLDILGETGIHLQPENIRLTSIHFRSGELALRMEIDELRSFDGIKARLARAGLAVEVLSVTSRDDTVMAHLKIRRPAGERPILPKPRQ
uniref:Type II secretion system protein L n=1 Tax=Candidatus Kentrum sp. LPFa TaxID=2126335 RepID=A0A450W2R4_9GAMM|nr:MAG: general secretion pathway protein L [Candidatus Kentron sp. LPFa]VFK33135.1 MAG: general secretion pathway protein L [Candidatus Kentron sp. LPFa]